MDVQQHQDAEREHCSDDEGRVAREAAGLDAGHGAQAGRGAYVGRAMSVMADSKGVGGSRCGKSVASGRCGAGRSRVGAEHEEVGVLERGLGRHRARRRRTADDVVPPVAGAPADDRVRCRVRRRARPGPRRWRRGRRRLRRTGPVRRRARSRARRGRRRPRSGAWRGVRRTGRPPPTGCAGGRPAGPGRARSWARRARGSAGRRSATGPARRVASGHRRACETFLADRSERPTRSSTRRTSRVRCRRSFHSFSTATYSTKPKAVMSLG